MIQINENSFHRIVIKLGTQVLIRDNGHLNTQLIGSVAQWAADQVQKNKQLMIVTSGAVGLGRHILMPSGVKPNLLQKQACAAIGQPLLMGMYHSVFMAHHQAIAQVLLSASDFASRSRYLNLKDTLETLMSHRIIPILNENDALSTTELVDDATHSSFGDNDQLSALLAAKLNADLLIILTNVDGVFTDNPMTNPQATRINRINHLSQLEKINISGQSSLGRGGMQSKIQATRLAAMCGVTSWIAPAWAPLDDCWEKADRYGTWVDALPQELIKHKAQWIGYASGFAGIITINQGAADALLQRGASLLLVGITKVQGEFKAKQVISIQTDDGVELGRGQCSLSSHELIERLHLQPEQQRGLSEVVHRNNLVLF